jgi:type IV pilus assembly protein PilV
MSVNTPPQQRGFSMVEVLVSVVLIAIGLLGSASLQALSMNNTSVARYRSLATIKSDSLAATMHANAGYWQNTALVPVTIANGFSITGSVVSDPTLDVQATDCSSAACTPVQMAGYDLKQWGAEIASLLPAGTGNVKCALVGTNPITCVITISWTENNVALNKVSGTETGTLASGTTVTQSYSVVVQP